MTSKLNKKAQKSKLQDLTDQEELFNLKPINSAVRSFRLDNQTWQDLQDILNKLNNHSQRKKISASLLIKALIYLGKTSKEEKLIKALKEVNF